MTEKIRPECNLVSAANPEVVSERPALVDLISPPNVPRLAQCIGLGDRYRFSSRPNS